VSSKTIPGSERVQVVTQDQIERDALTLYIDEDGSDVRLFASSTDEGEGFPFRAGDEIPVPEESGLFSSHYADGLWMETVGNDATAVQVLKGVALRRNPRRRNVVEGTDGVLTTSTVGSIETDNYTLGDGFDFDGGSYPYSVDPTATIQELVITTAGNVEAEITTDGGSTFTLPLAGGSGAFDKWSIASVTFRDPENTGARLAGGWAGE
jgi:hypothetical protein